MNKGHHNTRAYREVFFGLLLGDNDEVANTDKITYKKKAEAVCISKKMKSLEKTNELEKKKPRS